MESILLDWPFVGLLIAAVGAGVLLIRPHAGGFASRFQDPSWLFWILGPVYMLHQFEEHGFNLLGQRYHFQQELCANLGFAADLSQCPADRSFIFAANVGGVWIAALAAGIAGARRAMIGAAVASLPLVNGLAHILSGVARGAYNSGLLTSVVLFLPVSAWVLSRLYREGCLDGFRIGAAVGCALLMHVILIGSLLSGLSGPFRNALQVVNGFVPVALGLALGTPARRRSARL